jgi:hypothetical protein
MHILPLGPSRRPSDVNVLRKLAGTILGGGFNKYYLFFVWILWPKFGRLITKLCITECLTVSGKPRIISITVSHNRANLKLVPLKMQFEIQNLH